MPHFLTTVRAAVTGVCTGLPTTAARVFTRRPYPWQPAQLPGLLVRTAATYDVVDIGAPPTLQADTRIEVELVVAAAGDAAAALDTMASEVQAAVCGLTSIGGKAVTVACTEVTAPEDSGELDPPVSRRALLFSAGPLFIVANAPDVLV